METMNKEGNAIGCIVTDKHGTYFIPNDSIYQKQPGLFLSDIEKIQELLKQAPKKKGKGNYSKEKAPSGVPQTYPPFNPYKVEIPYETLSQLNNLERFAADYPTVNELFMIYLKENQNLRNKLLNNGINPDRQ